MLYRSMLSTRQWSVIVHIRGVVGGKGDRALVPLGALQNKTTDTGQKAF